MFHRKKCFRKQIVTFLITIMFNNILSPLISLSLVFHLSVFTRPGGCLSLHAISQQPLLSFSHTFGHSTPPAVTPTTAATAATTNTDRCSTGKMLLLPFPYTRRRYSSIENACIFRQFDSHLLSTWTDFLDSPFHFSLVKLFLITFVKKHSHTL